MAVTTQGRDEILVTYSEAMLEAQHLEEALVGLLGVREELEAAGSASEMDPISAVEEWEELFRLPAGGLARRLELAGNLGDEVKHAIEARNLLAHHYLRDHETRMDSADRRGGMVADLERARERFGALAAKVEAERFAAMHEHGVTDDEVTTPGEARRLRYYDPGAEDAIPPVPFES